MNPITSILLSINAPGTEKELEKSSKELQEFIRIIKVQIQNNDKKEKFLLSELINDCLILIKHKALTNSVRVISIIKDDFYLFGNRLSLMRIIINLINNAIESYENFYKTKKDIVIYVYKDSKYINISIKDFGCGIKPEDKNKIFRLLYTNKNNGTGIGLYFSKHNLRKDYMGKIILETKVNKGSNFIIKIPLKTSLQFNV